MNGALKFGYATMYILSEIGPKWGKITKSGKNQLIERKLLSKIKIFDHVKEVGLF